MMFSILGRTDIKLHNLRTGECAGVFYCQRDGIVGYGEHRIGKLPVAQAIAKGSADRHAGFIVITIADADSP